MTKKLWPAKKRIWDSYPVEDEVLGAFEAPKLNKGAAFEIPKDPTATDEVTGELVGELISMASWPAELATPPLVPKSGAANIPIPLKAQEENAT